MTPYQLQTIIHIYCIASPLTQTPILKETVDEMIADGLVVPDCRRGPEYALTERGEAFVGLLCAMPLPTASWSVPMMEWRATHPVEWTT